MKTFSLPTSNRTRILIGICTTLVVVSGSFAIHLLIKNAHAASLANWNPGNIISDSVFLDSTSMNPTQIQNFLQSKVPVCDTWGTQPSEFGGGTRAQWGAAHGNPAPFICLKDYSEGGRSAAQIIFDTGQEFNINPQVLLVLLQKEQGLVTDTWPLTKQYRTATGYGCPDTAPCDSQYFGLTNQLRWAARMFKAILSNSSTWYTPYVLGNNFIRWSPNSACGGTTVNIQNRATQALYNYTPYQPNQAALNAGYGTGDGCSAYGNRNFYLYFTDWFGSTHEGTVWRWAYAGQDTYTNSNYTNKTSINEPSVAPGALLYAEVRALNSGNQTWNNMTRIIPSRPDDRSSVFYDSSWMSNNRIGTMQETQVAPGSIGTFRFTLRAPQTIGTYREYFNLVVDGVKYLNNPGLFFTINVTNSITARNSSNVILQKGETLHKHSYLLSPDTNSTLTVQRNGNLALANSFITRWQTGSAGSGASKFIFQNDGNLVLYTDTMQPVWATGTDGSAASKLILQEDGNLVLYTASNNVVWQTGTNQNPTYFEGVTRTILNSGEMRKGQRIETAERSTKLFFQNDGNVVLYKGNQPLWATGTDGKDADRLIMQTDGNLVLYDKAMKPLWYSGTAGNGSSRLELQSDNNLVIYRAGEQATWATYTH